jgi:hypothetical protein
MLLGFSSFYEVWMIVALENPFLCQDIQDQRHL